MGFSSGLLERRAAGRVSASLSALVSFVSRPGVFRRFILTPPGLASARLIHYGLIEWVTAIDVSPTSSTADSPPSDLRVRDARTILYPVAVFR